VNPINAGDDLLYGIHCGINEPTRLAAGGRPEMQSPGGIYFIEYFN